MTLGIGKKRFGLLSRKGNFKVIEAERRGTETRNGTMTVDMAPTLKAMKKHAKGEAKGSKIEASKKEGPFGPFGEEKRESTHT